MTGTVYDRLGTRPVVNAKGIYTDLGGAIVSPAVWTAMSEANVHAVEMSPLLKAAGQRIANVVGVEAAWVTPGASAAIALATAACMTGTDGAAIERLPDTRGLPRTVLVQRGHRTRYARMCWLTGAHLVEITEEGLEEALDPSSVACVFCPGHLDAAPGTVPLAEVFRLCRERGVPSLVDAAFLNYPPDTMRRFVDAGADLACFSAKYYYGPSGGGFVCGRADLVDAVAGVDFTGFEDGEWLTFGRPFKLDRHTVVGTVAALEEWHAMDHEARWAGYARAVDVILDALADLPGLELERRFFTMIETLEPEPVNCLVVRHSRAADLRRRLWDGDPRVVVHLRDGALVVAVDALAPGEELLVAERLRAALSSS